MLAFCLEVPHFHHQGQDAKHEIRGLSMAHENRIKTHLLGNEKTRRLLRSLFWKWCSSDVLCRFRAASSRGLAWSWLYLTRFRLGRLSGWFWGYQGETGRCNRRLGR